MNFHLKPLLLLLVLLLSITNPSPISCGQENEQYRRCGSLFNCGKNIRGIDYPFWGGNRPEECGYPGLGLDCVNGSTMIQIQGLKYRVLDINQETQILKLARNDFSQNLCTKEFKNTTLDLGLFDYASGYVNLTFLYGCPSLNFPVPYQFDCPVEGTAERKGYVDLGLMQMSAILMCRTSLVVPVSYTSFLDSKDLQEVVRQGFEVRVKVSGENGDCSGCVSSGGRCGYDVGRKRLACLCPNGQSSTSGRNGTCSGVVADGGRNRSPQSSMVAVAPSASGTYYVLCRFVFQMFDQSTT